MLHHHGVRTAARLLFWPLAGTVVFLALCPADLLVPGASLAGYPQHALAFAILAATCTFACDSRWRVMAALAALAMVLELAQTFSPGRHVDVFDLLAGIAGITVGFVIQRA